MTAAERCKRWRNRLSAEAYQRMLDASVIRTRAWRAAQPRPLHFCDDCGVQVPSGNFDVCRSCARERAAYRTAFYYRKNRIAILAKLRAKRKPRTPEQLARKRELYWRAKRRRAA